MISLSGAYRLLSALLVVALVFSASLPLAGYVCEPLVAGSDTPARIMANPDAAPADACSDVPDCRSVSTSTGTSAIPPVMDFEAACCTPANVKKARAVVASKTSLAPTLLPAVVLPTTETPLSSVSSPYGHGRDVSSFASVPVRLFTSVFLL